MDYEGIKRELGLRIKSYRKSNNLTQDKLSSMISLEAKNLSKIENGKSLPQTQTLISLIENAEIEPNYLLGFLAKKTPSYSTIDYEILDLLIDLPSDTKKHIKEMLLSLKDYK